MTEEQVAVIISKAVEQQKTVILESSSVRCITGKVPAYTSEDIIKIIDKLRGVKDDQ
jgi:hypothetical protein